MIGPTTPSLQKLQWKYIVDTGTKEVAPTGFEIDRSDQFFCSTAGKGDGGYQFFWGSGWPIMLLGRGVGFLKSSATGSNFFAINGCFDPILARGLSPIPPPSRTGGMATPVLCWRGVPLLSSYRISHSTKRRIFTFLAIDLTFLQFSSVDFHS